MTHLIGVNSVFKSLHERASYYVRNKQEELGVLAQSQNYDVIAIMETQWELA